MTRFWKRAPKADEGAYFEAWGDALATVSFLKGLCLCLAAGLVIALGLLGRTLQNPPLVIRVDDVGRAEALGAVASDARVTLPELDNFSRLFMTRFLERNVYTWEANLKEAGRMMTPQFREKANSDGNLATEAASIKSQRLKSEVVVTDVKPVRETDEAVIVAVMGHRKIGSYEEDGVKQEVVFSAEVAVKKVPRTMAEPYGLLVDGYAQTDFKHE